MTRKNYEAHADQAIISNRWQEAAELLQKGAPRARSVDSRFRMHLRKAAIPFYQDTVHLERRHPTRLSDAAIDEVHEEVVELLRTARTEYTDIYADEPVRSTSNPKQKEYIGILVELGMFALGSHARRRQLDEVLVVPSLYYQDHGGTFANDLGMYRRGGGVGWHNEPRTSIQAKHSAPSSTIAKYDPSIVVMAFRGDRDRHSLDEYAVLDPLSIVGRLLEGDGTHADNYLDGRYFVMRRIVKRWPEIREEAFREEIATPITHTMDLTEIQNRLGLQSEVAIETGNYTD